MDTWLWPVLGLFFVGLIFSMSAVFKAAANGDYTADMSQAITYVTVVNLVLILVLAGTAYFYTGQYTNTREPYIMFMLHLSLLLSVISVSVSSLYSVSN
jgi:hypothetical protein